jgi:predicted DNA-binding protein (MmcQ/YjbR family)
MDNERIRALCLALPHVRETLNWGYVLVYWVGDREIGGKMFALTNADGGTPVLSFHCGVERFHELLEKEGMIPAPHLGRAHWVAMDRWDALRPREVEEALKLAHGLIYEKLPKKTKAMLEAAKGTKKRGSRD